jgi:ABC-type spermidine/putrescine transport system permease subunit II
MTLPLEIYNYTEYDRPTIAAISTLLIVRWCS